MTITLCSEQDIIDEAGVGASTAITLSSSWLQRLGSRAEGEVIAETRRDWITGILDTNTYVAELVKSAVAKKAAIYVVKYDGKNYFSRLEQETVLDVLTDGYNKAIKSLNDTDVNNIRTVA